MPKKESKFKELLNTLNINETYTKPTKKPKVFTKVKDNVPPVKNYNMMADVLILPTTKEGYNALLVVVDLASDLFDIEPIKSKEPKQILEAFKEMFKRKYLNVPYASIQTDAGTEFKGEVHDYFFDKNIFHKIAVAGRHSQMSNVESLNRQLGRFFNGYMNAMEKKTGKPYNEWTDVVDKIRTSMNEIRKKKLPEDWKKHLQPVPDPTIKPKYKINDVVIRKSEVPLNALGHKQPTTKFREADYRWIVNEPRKIVSVIPYAGAVPYRYMLEGLKNVSFTEDQLMLADKKVSLAEQQEEPKEIPRESEYTIKKIIGERTRNKKKEYLVWWDKYLRKDATYEPEERLLEDVGRDFLNSAIKEFRAEKRKKKK